MSIDGQEVKFATILAKRSFLIILAAVSALLLLLAAERVYFQTIVSKALAEQTLAEEIKGRILLTDEILSASARGYAQTSDGLLFEKYNRTLPLIFDAIDKAKAMVSVAAAKKFESETSVSNNELAALETQSMELASKGQKTEALAILDSRSYRENKVALAAGVDHFMTVMKTELQANFNRTWWVSLGLMMFSSLFGIIGALVLWRRLTAAMASSERAYIAVDASIRAQLAAANDESLKASRMAQLGQLTATVAHEIRNPLGAIRTSAFLVQKKIAGQNLGVEKAMDRITNGVRRCDDIITELLDYSRTSSNKSTAMDFDAWLEKTLQDTAEALPTHVNIICNLGLNGQDVSFDPSRMQRVVINLVNNASEAMVGKGDLYSGPKDGNATITVNTVESAGGVSLTVADNGPGISPENLAKVLQPLFTTKSFGTGLGLPAVQKIMEQHNGHLKVDSEVGKGATFTAWFPITAPPEEETEAIAA